MYVKKTPIISMSITDSISPNDTGINFRYPILSLKNADIKICINRHPKKKGFSFNYENPNDMLYAKFLDVKNDKIIVIIIIENVCQKLIPKLGNQSFKIGASFDANVSAAKALDRNPASVIPI